MKSHEPLLDYLSEALIDAALAVAIAVIVVVPLVVIFGVPV